MVERVRVGSQHGHAAERDRAADETGRERARSELSLERRFAEPGGVGAEKHSRQVGGGRDGEDADQERGRVEPARELVAGGVPDRDAARSDTADRCAQCERGQDRRERKHAVDRAQLVRRRRACTQRIGGAAEDDPHRGDEERDRERRADRAERARVGGPDDGEHEDQPDVVRFPDGTHRAVGVVADRSGVGAVPRGQLPPAGAEVGSCKHGVRGEPDQREEQGKLVEMHDHASLAAVGTTTTGSNGTRASRRRIQATASASPT